MLSGGQPVGLSALLDLAIVYILIMVRTQGNSLLVCVIAFVCSVNSMMNFY
jgi:hypothetical protein